jgi:hypothetical protein
MFVSAKLKTQPADADASAVRINPRDGKLFYPGALPLGLTSYGPSDSLYHFADLCQIGVGVIRKIS